MATPGSIRLELLGSPRVIVDGEPVTSFRTNRIPALLGYLSVNRGAQRRERVADALWPHLSEDAGRHNLRQTLVYVRQLLGPGAVISDRTSLELGEPVTSDARDLLDWDEAPIDGSKGDILLRQIRGSFLEGSDDDWGIEAREQLAQCHVALLLALADASMELQPDLALAYAASAVREEPLQDGARARKIRALRRLGEDSAAEKEFAEFARLLKSELQIEPAQMVRTALTETKTPEALKPQPEQTEPAFEADAIDRLLASGRPDYAIDLAVALAPYWVVKGQAQAGLALVRRLLDTPQVAEAQRGMAQVVEAELCVAVGLLGDAQRLLDDVIKTTGSRTVKCRALNLVARVALYRYRSARGLTAAEESLRLSQEKAMPYMTLAALRTAALTSLQAGDPVRSEAFAKESIELADRVDDPNSKAWGILTLGELREHADDIPGAREASDQIESLYPRLSGHQRLAVQSSASRLLESIGELDRAEAGYRECAKAAAAQRNELIQGIVLTYLGDLQIERGDLEGAIETHRRAIELRKPKDDTLGLATSLRGLGKALFRMEDYPAAKEALAESARGFVEADAVPGYASALLLLARVEEAIGNRPGAARLALRSLHLMKGLPPHHGRAIGPSGENFLLEASVFLSFLAGPA